MIDCAWCPMPAEPGATLCPGCLEASAADIAALPSDWRALGLLEPAVLGLQQRVSGSRAPSVPIDLRADELARAIVWTLGVWEPPVREAAGMSPASEKVHPERLVDRAASLLSWRVSDFSALGDTWGYPEGLSRGCVARSGLYGVSSLRRLHERSRYVLPADEPSWQLPGLCGRCGAAALARRGERVECRYCGHRVDVDDYRAFLGFESESVHHPIG